MTEDIAQEIDSALQKLGSEILEINRSNGWNVTSPEDWPEIWPDEFSKYKIPTKLVLIHSEISEALESFRASDQEGFLEEMADAIIRILDCTHGLNMNLGAMILSKIETNKHRGYRHGGKVV